MAHAVNESRPGSLESTEFGFTEDDEFVGPDVDTHNKRRTRRVSTDTKWGTVLPGSSDRLHDNYVLHVCLSPAATATCFPAQSKDADKHRLCLLLCLRMSVVLDGGCQKDQPPRKTTIWPEWMC